MVDMALNDEALNIINGYRRSHDSPPLVLDSELSQSAQHWAEEMAKTCTVRHGENKEYGELLAYKSAYEGPVVMTAMDACDQWYEQETMHDYDGGFTYETGYFTQMIWSKSTRVGFGRALSENKDMAYIVAHLLPKGNITGEFKANVHSANVQHRIPVAQTNGPASRSPSYTGHESPNRPISVVSGETDKERKLREKNEKKEQDRQKKLEEQERKKREAEERKKDKERRKSKGSSRSDLSDGPASRISITDAADETKEQRKAREKAEKEEQKRLEQERKDKAKRDAKERKENDRRSKSRSDLSLTGSVGGGTEESKEDKKAREKIEKEEQKRQAAEKKRLEKEEKAREKDAKKNK